MREHSLLRDFHAPKQETKSPRQSPFGYVILVLARIMIAAVSLAGCTALSSSNISRPSACFSIRSALKLKVNKRGSVCAQFLKQKLGEADTARGGPLTAASMWVESGELLKRALVSCFDVGRV